MNKKLTAGVVALSMAFVFAIPPLTVAAVAQSENNGSSPGSSSGTDTGSGSTNGNQPESVGTNSKKLEGNALKACQNKEQNINTFMNRVNERTQAQAELFGTIAERVQQFYQDNGLSVVNYEDLVAQVETTRAQVQTMSQTMQQSQNSFSCTGEDPKGSAQQYKNSFQNQLQYMKDYKTAVRNLIVAVKTAVGSTGEAE